MKRCFSCFKEFDDKLSVCPYCGLHEINRPKEPVQLMPGTILVNRYIVGESVGAGGFGIVYKAWDTKLKTIVAVKEFFVSRLVTRAEGLENVIVAKKSQVEFAYRKERFLAEARNMAKFGAHRSIPNVFDFFEDNNTAYIVMEFLDGVTLNEYLKQNNGEIDTDFAIMIANEVALALKTMHQQNIIHRDVAPDNIFICFGKEIRIKLMDLGAAKLADSTDQFIDVILKPGYSPPEQYDNSKNIGPWTDIYALGATLYKMLSGIKPDEATNRKEKDTVVPLNQLNNTIPENFSNTVMKSMAIERHMRFNDIDEFLKALNGDKKVLPLTKERKKRNLKRIVGIVGTLLIVALVSGIVLNTYNDKRSVQYLDKASINVWISVTDNSSEEQAMKAVISDFEKYFPDVSISLRSIPEDSYDKEIRNAMENDSLPDLFESSGLSYDVLNNAVDLTKVIESEQFKDCLFFDQYFDYYNNNKQIPLGIEIPVAYIITNGPVFIDYNSNYFSNLSDLGSNISVDEDYAIITKRNYSFQTSNTNDDFLISTPVLLSSSMKINDMREKLVNYEKTVAYYNGNKIICNFTYEWSIGNGTAAEIAASERLLSWMLGNNYQNILMISQCNEGQIPVNKNSFYDKIQSIYLSPIENIYNKFVFENITE